ncbi:extracellular solute-binding protein [Sinorhizobium meliloti]|uniref:extracellular solute-binding protein n=1 Tax=Rhizobium meliloti TaxID=382 RepID=UPI000FDBAA42|nr:extracellular solute-binding protein [Sinorhizobium meliloti]RVK45729.1 extracellular solute-binding protein [Sinorhizobium meliloti]RVM82896.1 extracellular solute-binding protein [Sinorhizobium meliloti]RVN68036.1 extracellular solute-binding protein [Sinorhizobium meliloti]RVO29805.1 extracellular solute-binding protein [Sinorhizobium meliloti]RVP91323.1 extracellular solute-binding protein [Sinorhizobium meliloti]
MNKKLAILAICIAMYGQGANAQDRVTISVASSGHSSMYNEIASKFMAENPNIEVKLLPSTSNYDQLLQNLLQDKIVNRLPDVAFMSINQTELLIEREIAQPLMEFIDQDGERMTSSGLGDNLMQTCTLDNQVFCLPFAVSVPILYYNSNLLNEVGIHDQFVPKSWDELISIGKSVHEIHPDVSPLYFSYLDHSANWTTTALLNSVGGSLLNAERDDIAFDTAAGAWSFEIIKRFGKVGQLDISLNQARQAFAAGTLAILSTSSSHLGRIQEQVGDQFVLKVAPWPREDSDGWLPAGGNSIFLLTTEPEKQQAAWRFIKFAISPQGQAIMVRESGYMPVNAEVLQDPRYLGDYFDANPNQQVAAEQAQFVTRWEAFPGTNGLKASDLYRDTVQKVMAGELEPDAALSDLAAQIRDLLKQGQ